MPKSTEKKTGFGKFGGSNHMYGFRGTGTQEPGQSAQEGTGPKRGIAPKAGGDKAFVSSGASNTDYAGTQKAGVSAATKSGGDAKFASGGNTRMFGNTGSRKMVPGQSSQ